MRYQQFLLGLLAYMCCAAVLVGCGGDDGPTKLPTTNENFVDADGRPVGHLKPEPYNGPPVGADGQPIKVNDPVVWVVDGGEVSQPQYEIDVKMFRLDFDEKQPLTEAVMPYVLMTENTKQIVIHRGPPPAGFSHPDINDGEPCVPVYRCGNLQCPRVQEIQNFAIFPSAAGGDQPPCPFCQSSESVAPYQSPQHENMRRHLQSSGAGGR